LDGDYNHNGVVDGADYVMWRKNDGTPAGYNLWRSNFGHTMGSGSVSAVPEPVSVIMVLIAYALTDVRVRRRSADT
jgi:hypothetical protein